MEICIVWVVGAIIAGAIANGKGRGFAGYFLLGLFCPLIGIVAAALARPDTKTVENQKLFHGEMKKCPFCAELIKTEALICRYCQKEQPKPKG